jgi:hypothetical protein
VILIQECKTKNDPSMEAVLSGVKALASEMGNQKAENGLWIQFPSWGGANLNYDFRLVNRFDNFEDVGTAYDVYAPGTTAWAAVQQAAGDIFSCKVNEVGFVTPRRYMPE